MLRSKDDVVSFQRCATEETRNQSKRLAKTDRKTDRFRKTAKEKKDFNEEKYI